MTEQNQRTGGDADRHDNCGGERELADQVPRSASPCGAQPPEGALATALVGGDLLSQAIDQIRARTQRSKPLPELLDELFVSQHRGPPNVCREP
jgi:hypothetical protein